MSSEKTIPIHVRLKPKLNGSGHDFKKAVIAHDLSTNVIRLLAQTKHDIDREVRFHKVFDSDTTQQDLFNALVAPKLKKVLEHDNDYSLFTFGPSGSGKSFTMFGSDNNPGIIIRVLRMIYEELNTNGAICSIKKLKDIPGFHNLIDSCTGGKAADGKGDKAITLSMFELYNDSFKDLLTGKIVQKSNTEMYTNKDNKITAKVTQAFLRSYDDAMDTFKRALRMRAVAKTKSNSLSSRSHCFIYINYISLAGNNSFVSSRFTLADLAGNERTNIAQTQGDSLKEGSATNSSLSELGRVLELFKNNQISKSAIRNSKLTRLLFSDYINLSDVSLSILVNLDPLGDPSTILQTLRFIQPVKHISANCVSNASKSRSVSPQLSGPYKAMCELYRTKLDQVTIEYEHLQSQLLSTEMRIRNEVSNEYEESIKNLTKKYEESKFNDHDNFQGSTDKKLEKLKTYYNGKIEELKTSNEKSILSKIELEKKIADLEEQNLDCKIELENFILDFEDKAKDFEEENSGLETELRNLQAMNAEYVSKIEELVFANTDLQKQYKRIPYVNGGETDKVFRDQIDSLSVQNKQYENKVRSLESSLDSTVAELRKSTESKKKLISDHETEKHQLRQLIEKQKSVISKLSEITDKNADKQTCRNTKTDNTNILQERSNLRHHLNNLSPFRSNKKHSEPILSRLPIPYDQSPHLKQNPYYANGKKRFSVSPARDILENINATLTLSDDYYESTTGSPTKKKKKLSGSPKNTLVYEDNEMF